MKRQFLKIVLVSIITSCFLVTIVKVAKAQGIDWSNMFNMNNMFSWGGGWNMPQYNYNYNWMNNNEDDDDDDRQAAWHETEYQTNAWGGTTMIGRFGPDIGYGEQGTIYEYTDPMSGSFMRYETTGMGTAPGMAGFMPVYGGMYSSVGGPSYGPYAGGNRPQIQSTPTWDTQGFMSGNLWGQNTNYFSGQYNPMAGFMFGLAGMFGGGNYGYGGWGGYGGTQGGYPTRLP